MDVRIVINNYVMPSNFSLREVKEVVMSTKSLRAFRVSFIGITLMVAGPLLFSMGFGSQSARAVQCGDTVTTDITLTANLGPCPGDGLVLNGDQITVNLNGHTISGTAVGSGILFSGVQQGTIKGPGTITNFVTGITMGGGAGAVMIYNIIFTKNTEAIWMAHPNGNIRVLNNVILGTGQQGKGIEIGGGSTAYIYQNTVSGYPVGIYIGTDAPNVFVDENLVTLNQTGIWAFYPDRTCFTIRGNRVLFNQGDGIRTGANPASMVPMMAELPILCLQGVGGNIEDNTVTNNQRNGILVQAGSLSSQYIFDNEVTSNRTNGISVQGSRMPNATGVVQTIGNYTERNGTDLFWDDVGMNYCWQQNVYSTSSPLFLPSC